MDPERTAERDHPVATAIGESLVLLMLFAGTGFLTMLLIWWVAVDAGTVPGTLPLTVANALIFLPFASLVGGLVATVRPRNNSRPWLGTATTVALSGTLLTLFVLAIGLPSGAERDTYRAAAQARADAALQATVLARPDITVVEERFAQLRTRLDVELSGAVPGVRWTSAASRRIGCDAGGNRDGVQITSVGTIGIADPDWAATDAAVRRAAAPFGFTGPPITRNGYVSVGFHLDGPDDSRLWVYRDKAGGPVSAGLESGCHRPGPA